MKKWFEKFTRFNRKWILNENKSYVFTMQEADTLQMVTKWSQVDLKTLHTMGAKSFSMMYQTFIQLEHPTKKCLNFATNIQIFVMTWLLRRLKSWMRIISLNLKQQIGYRLLILS